MAPTEPRTHRRPRRTLAGTDERTDLWHANPRVPDFETGLLAERQAPGSSLEGVWQLTRISGLISVLVSPGPGCRVRGAPSPSKCRRPERIPASRLRNAP